MPADKIRGRDVRVFRNLHQDCWSVEDKKTGHVVAHADRVELSDAEMVVREGGRQRVLSDQAKNVHAFVSGTVENLTLKGEDLPAYPSATYVYGGKAVKSGKDSRIKKITYNPYSHHSFVTADAQRAPVWKAEKAVLEADARTVWVVNPEDSSPQPISSKEMRDAMSGWPSGVAVVTVMDEENRQRELHGMTVSSLSSVSLEPPLISFSTSKDSRTLAMAQERGSFAVNILGSDQVDTCWNFCSKEDNRFEGVKFRAGKETGAPLLDDAQAHLECQVSQVIEVTDDRVLVIGQVVSADSDHDEDGPLVNFRNQMGTFHG